MDHADQAKEGAGEKAPVASCKPLQGLGSPEPFQLEARQQDLGLLNGLGGATLGEFLDLARREQLNDRAEPVSPRAGVADSGSIALRIPRIIAPKTRWCTGYRRYQ